MDIFVRLELSRGGEFVSQVSEIKAWEDSNEGTRIYIKDLNNPIIVKESVSEVLQKISQIKEESIKNLINSYTNAITESMESMQKNAAKSSDIGTILEEILRQQKENGGF